MNIRNISLLLSVLFCSILDAQVPVPELLLKGADDSNYFDMKKKFESRVGNYPTYSQDFDNKFQRMNYILEPRLYPSGEWKNIDALNLQAKLDYEEDLRRTNPNYAKTESTTGSWSQYGGTIPGLIGRVDRVAFHPTNSNIMYAGAAGGGLWRTTDGGSTWSHLTADLGQISICGLGIHPTNPNIIYIMTGEYQTSMPLRRPMGSLGVLKSTDSGKTWYGTDLSWQANARVDGLDLIVHPTNGNIVLVSSAQGIFKTSNGGATFTQVSTISNAFDLEWKPNDPSVVYAAGDNEVYRSTSTGDSWTTINDPSFPGSGGQGAISVTPADDRYVYVIFGNSANKGVFRSFDSGLNFDPKETTDITGPFSWYTLEIAVSNTSAARVTVGGIRSNTSNNFANAGTFSSTFTGTHADVQEMKYHPITNELFLGTDGGLYKSSDHGANWTDITNNMRITQFYRISGSADNTSRIMAGAQDNSNQLFNSSTSASLKDCCDGMDNAIIESDADIIYYSAQRSVFFLSTNGANSKIDISDPALWTPWNASNPWISPIIPDPVGSNLASFGVRDVLQYTRSSNTWVSKNHPGTSQIRAMAQGTSNRNRFYTIAGTTIRRSDNYLSATPSWTTKMNGLPSFTSWYELAVNPNNSLELWVVASGYNAGSKVYHSTSGGDNWTNLSGSLPNVPINVIKYHDNGLNNDALYIGTDIGVFYRNNSIGDWVPFTNFLPNAIVTDLYINHASNKVFASTFGRGVWISDVFGACPNDLSFSNFLGLTFGGTRYYQAADHIDSQYEYEAGIGTNINYEAGNYINLTPGFWIKSVSKFEGKIGPCHTNLTTPLQNKNPGKYMGLLPTINTKSNKVLTTGQ